VPATRTGAGAPSARRSYSRVVRLLLAGTMAAAGLAAYPVLAGATGLCDLSACSKTVSVSNGAMTNPVAGVVTINGLNPSTSYSVVDALQALPNDQSNRDRYYQGSYTLSWNSCTSGSATGSTFNVGPNLAGTGFAVGVPPMTSGPLVSITAGSGGSVVCAYTLTFTASPVVGTVVSVRNDIFLMNGSSPVAHFASISVGAPPLTPPPGIPESPLMVLLPVSALAVFGLVFLKEFRRQARTAVG
jgi:hypothetical protein